MHENGLKDRELTLPDAAMNRIIREYTREAGLRNLEREIGTVCRKIARRKAEGSKPPFRVTAAGLPRLLGAPIFIDDEAERKLIPGVALGLAWTPAGGEILYIEVSAIKGKGGLTLTGQLGDVMKESAQAALTYARAKADELGIAPDFAEHTDIHIHVPAGATPKDGPSAGVTLVTALISALTGKTVRGDICMTGEITLRGASARGRHQGKGAAPGLRAASATSSSPPRTRRIWKKSRRSSAARSSSHGGQHRRRPPRSCLKRTKSDWGKENVSKGVPHAFPPFLNLKTTDYVLT